MKLSSLALIALLLVPIAAVAAQANPIDSDATPDKAYNASRIVLYSSVVFDLTTTERAIAHGAREANPLLGQGRYRRLGVAIGATVGADLLTRKLRRDGHGKAATVVNFILSSVHITAGGLNLRFGPQRGQQ